MQVAKASSISNPRARMSPVQIRLGKTEVSITIRTGTAICSKGLERALKWRQASQIETGITSRALMKREGDWSTTNAFLARLYVPQSPILL